MPKTKSKQNKRVKEVKGYAIVISNYSGQDIYANVFLHKDIATERANIHYSKAKVIPVLITPIKK